MREEPKELQIYKHFKGNLYQIITVAIHSETGERLVIYRPLYKESEPYARPLEMFMSEVDHKKYPEVTQKYRFELMGAEMDNSPSEPAVKNESQVDINNSPDIVVNESNTETAYSPAINEETMQLDPLLEEFLDAGSYEEKLDVFYKMKRRATLPMLSYVAMSLDIEVSKETVEEQYAEILYCLKTMEKFECNRLRP